MLLLGKINEVKVFALLDIHIIYNNDWRAFADLTAELGVMLLLDLNERVSLLSALTTVSYCCMPYHVLIQV